MAEKTFFPIIVVALIGVVGFSCMVYIGVQVLIMERSVAYACGRFDQTAKGGVYRSMERWCGNIRRDAISSFNDALPEAPQ